MMTRTAAVAGVVVVFAAACFFLRGASGDAECLKEETHSAGAHRAGVSGLRGGPGGDTAAAESAKVEVAPVTKEEFEELPEAEKEAALEAYVDAFWELESGALGDAGRQERHISLDIFGRPYMRTVTEAEFSRLSAADQEQVIGETMESCREARGYVQGTIAEAKAIRAEDPLAAEAHLIAALETGRDLNSDKDGMFITRVVGIACEKAVLEEMSVLYVRLGYERKLAMARDRISELEAEKEQMRAAAERAGGQQ